MDKSSYFVIDRVISEISGHESFEIWDGKGREMGVIIDKQKVMIEGQGSNVFYLGRVQMARDSKPFGARQPFKIFEYEMIRNSWTNKRQRDSRSRCRGKSYQTPDGFDHKENNEYLDRLGIGGS